MMRVTPQIYGAVGDGAHDDTAAIQAMFNSGAEEFLFPRTNSVGGGTYRVTSALTLSHSSRVEFEPEVVLDGSAITTGAAVLKVSGAGLVALPDLAAAARAGTRSLQFVSAPTLATDDVVVIYNPTNGSFNAARSYYRAGEFCQVQSVTGSSATVCARLYDTYAAGIKAYKLDSIRFSLRGGTIIAPTGNTVNGLDLEFCRDFDISDLVLLGSEDLLLSVSRCYQGRIRNVRASYLSSNAPYGTAYGIVIGNSQDVDIVDCFAQSRRHAFSAGGGDVTGGVPNRNIKVRGGTYTSFAEQISAADFHGNSEYCRFDGITAEGGITLGGDKNGAWNCTIRGEGNDGSAILLSELLGFDMTIDSCEVYTYGGASTGRGVFLDVGGNSPVLNSDTVRGGTLRLLNNSFFDSANFPQAVHGALIRNRGCDQELNMIFSDNDFSATGATIVGLISWDRVSGAEFNSITCQGNRLQKGSIRGQSGKFIDVQDCEILGGGNSDAGVVLISTQTNGIVNVSDVVVVGAQHAGIQAQRSGSAEDVLVSVKNSSVRGYHARNSGGTYTNTGITTYAQTVQIFNCYADHQGWREPPRATASQTGGALSVVLNAGGSGLFVVPTVSITDSGGTGGSVAAEVGVETLGIAANGTGYAVGDVITATGGTAGAAASFTITAVDGSGGIIDFDITNPGDYSVLPSNPVSTTGGSGSGAQLNFLGLTIVALNVTPGSGYVSPSASFAVSVGGSGGAIRADTVSKLYASGNSHPITKSTVTTTMEIGFDGEYVVIPVLPGATPGGAGRLWRDAGAANVVKAT